jgi:hypothetical protein
MARQTKKDLEERTAYLARENDILQHALQCAAHGNPDSVEWWEHDGGRYSAKLYSGRAPHGGILLVTFYYPGQRPYTSAAYFDHWYSEVRRTAQSLGCHAASDAASRLWRARREAITAVAQRLLPESEEHASQ